jgi:rhodanese-related sulfurtransferase
MMLQLEIPGAGHLLGWTAIGTAMAAGAAAAAALLLWWLADHRTGLRWAASVIRRRFPDVRQISVRDLAAWLGDANRKPPVLWDVRSKEEYDLSHLPQAAHVPVDTGDEDLCRHLERAGDRAIVCYCSAGYRGAEMARRLRKLGAKDVCNLAGGVFHWANESLELMRGTEPATRVHSYHPLFRRLLKPERRSGRR